MSGEESISAPLDSASSGGLEGKVAVISGATGAIGGAFARRLAAAGADLLLLGRRRDVLDRLAAELASSVGTVETLAGDLIEEADIEAVRDRALALFAGVDLLVHSLGVFRAGAVEEAPAQDLDLQWNVNSRAPYLLTQRLLPSLLERRGQIVYVDSNAGLNTQPTIAGYSASKHALRALADGLRDEVNERGVRVLTVFPGRTASEMQRLVARHFGQEYRPEDLMAADDVARPVIEALLVPRTVEVTDLRLRRMRRPGNSWAQTCPLFDSSEVLLLRRSIHHRTRRDNMPRAVVAVAATLLFVSLALNPTAAYSQASKPPLAPLGPRTSDLNMTTRLNEAAERNRDSIGTLLFSYLGSGDFRTVMKKTNPQGLFFTLEVDGTQVKNVARGKKLKVEEAVEHGELRVLAKLSRPGRRLTAVCKVDMAVGFRQVIFLPYGGDEGYFSCHILPRLLPDELVAEWKEGFEQKEKEAFRDCAETLPRGSSSYWACIESAGIPLPLG